MQADIVLYNGKVYTMTEDRPRAQAVAIAGDKILAVGADRELKDMVAPHGAAIDLKGRTVVPGFIDSHIHFVEYSLGLRRIDLAGVGSKGEALSRVEERARVAEEGEWLLGSGWDRNLWEDGSLPTRADLDAVAPRNPVALVSKDLHTLWVNSAALAWAGITADTADPPGGKIQRDRHTGQPTGILKERAGELIQRVIGRPGQREIQEVLRAGIERAQRAGLTGIHDPEDEEAFIAFQELSRRGELGLRVYMHLAAENLEAAIRVGLRTGFGNDRLRIGGLKLYVDGALGSRTAFMLDPYCDEPHNRGIPVMDKEALGERVRRASRAGIQAVIHAIGDAANRTALDVLAEVRQLESSWPTSAGLRHRIEHVQLLHPDDIPRLACWDIIASMQPIHATADMDMVDRHWGEKRERGAYVFRRLLEAGTHLAFGSDCPVETFDPLRGIHAAVTRRRADGYPGPQGWHPEERLSVEEAVRAYTMGAAYASGEEEIKGSIAPGKLADLVVLSRDIFTIEPMEILETRVEATILDGRFVYRSEGL